MASAHFSLLSLPSPFTTRRTPYRVIVCSKTGQRKNYLRPKILKTLTKSYPPILSLPPPPPQPILSPPSPSEERNFSLEIADTQREDTFDDVEELDKLGGLQVSPATTTERNGFFGNVSAAAIFKYGGMCLVGAFVFQTVYSFWIFGNSHSNQKDGDLEVSARENSNFLFPENQLVMEKKIKEIKLMAREVRKIESEKKRKEDEDEDNEIDDESSVSGNNNFIEKEIDARLLRLQNRINSNKDSLAALHSNAHGKSVVGVERDGDKSANPGNEALVFKKRFKFKSPSTKTTKTPKGFSGTQDSKASNAKTTQVNQEDVAQKNTAGVPLEERGELVDDEPGAILSDGKNSEEKKETLNGKTKAGFETKSINNGGVKDSSVGMSSPEVIQSRGSTRTQNSQVFVEENQETPIFGMDNVYSVNGSSRQGLAKQNSAANIVEVKQANTKTDIWWLNLRYVLVILMQRGSNGEGSKGLYSLKFTSKKQEQDGESYTIAFEDHADANNFCFLLESFFDDVDDFRANAVPMSIQELNEEIISHGDRVVVVKKRQLQLYAGQPLPDVEMALCSIIEQDQNAP